MKARNYERVEKVCYLFDFDTGKSEEFCDDCLLLRIYAIDVLTIH